jgi:protein-tyrosine phosphatase
MNNRVKLKVPEGHNDYINASPIELKSTKSGAVFKYIATQVRWEERVMSGY